jgi:hypothetical protein
LFWILSVAISLPSPKATENTTPPNWIATGITANQDLSNPQMAVVSSAYHDVTEFDNQTIREIIHTTIAGSARLDNTFGTLPVTFDAVFVGKQKQGASLPSGWNRDVTFSGAKAVTIEKAAKHLATRSLLQ